MMQWSHSLAEKKPRALLDSTLDEADFRGECSLTTAMWWWNIRFLSSPSKLNWTGEASCQPQRFFPKSSRSNSRKCCWPQGNFPALENWRQKAKFRNKQFEERKFMSCAAAVGALLLHVYWSVVKLSRVDHVGWERRTKQFGGQFLPKEKTQ